MHHQMWHKYLGLGLAIVLVLIGRVASPAEAAEAPLLTELPKGEGADLTAPYELWVATFAPDEGSYGSGPRILIITNDRKKAVVYVRGKRVELQHVGELVWRCEPGGSMKETYQAGAVTVTTALTTSPGAEACWVEGAISVSLEHETQTFRVKGASGI
jgi:hypothetical protein